MRRKTAHQPAALILLPRSQTSANFPSAFSSSPRNIDPPGIRVTPRLRRRRHAGPHNHEGKTDEQLLAAWRARAAEETLYTGVNPDGWWSALIFMCALESEGFCIMGDQLPLCAWARESQSVKSRCSYKQHSARSTPLSEAFLRASQREAFISRALTRAPSHRKLCVTALCNTSIPASW